MNAVLDRQGSLNKIFELTFLYYVVGIVCIYYSHQPTSIMVIWLPDAIAVAFLVRSRLSEWPKLILCIAFADFMVSFMYGHPILRSIINSTGNLSGVLAAAISLKYFKVNEDFEYCLSTTAKLLIIIVFIAPLCASTIGNALLTLTGIPFKQHLHDWYFSCAIGLFTILPVALGYTSERLADLFSKENVIRNLSFLTATLMLTYFILAYMPFPFVYIALFPLIAATQTNVFITMSISACNLVFMCIMINLGFFPHLLPIPLLYGKIELIPIGICMLPAFILAVAAEEIRRKKEIVQQGENRFKDAMEYSAIGMAVVGINGTWLKVNHALCDMLGYTADELKVKTFQDITFPEDLDTSLTMYNDILSGAIKNYQLEKRYIRKDGQVIWALLAVSLVRNAKGEPEYFVAQIESVDWRKKAEREKEEFANKLHEEKERLHVTLYSIADGVLTTDKLGSITFLNPIAESLTGWKLADAFGLPHDKVFRLVGRDTQEIIQSPITKCLDKGSVFHLEENVKLISKHGEEFDVQSSAAPVRTIGGDILGAVLVFQNMTASREMQRELSYNATHDSLTDLYNRSKFEQLLNEAFTSAKEQKIHHSLCFLDIDGFKLINDSAGHAAGDLLLQTLSNLLQKHVRAVDVIARVGGDEFALLLYGCEIREAIELSERLIALIGEIRFPWQGHYYEVGASVGIVPIDNSVSTAAEILTRADIACYAAKNSGRNRVSIYQPGQSEAERQHREILMVGNMREAIERNRFILYAQEIVSINPDPDKPNHRHYELLLRMLDVHGKIVMPDEFIPAAERFGLITNIDRWVLQEALIKFGPSLYRLEDISIGINLSGHSLNDPKFLPFLLELIDNTLVPPDRIQFELTETALMHHISSASNAFAKLREVGCSVALDDFGSGFSSLNYLKNLPVDIIKIDGSFIHNIHKSLLDEAIVVSVNQIAHQLGAETVAEFVESQQILDYIKKIGVDYAQGFALHRPEPLKDVLDRLSMVRRSSGNA